MNCQKIVFTQHAFTRMFARELTTETVKEAIRSGEVIASYPDDQPYPSFLLLHKKGRLVLHVVIGIDMSADICFVVTAYRPDPDLWSKDFKTRRKP